MGAGRSTRIPLQISRNCIIASIQVDLSREVLTGFRDELLELLSASGATGVILDVSGVPVMDCEDFEGLRRTIAMARLMGAHSVVAGLQAGVVSSLVELGAETEDIVAALDLDDAFRMMESLKTTRSEMPDEDDHDERLFTASADQD